MKATQQNVLRSRRQPLPDFSHENREEEEAQLIIECISQSIENRENDIANSIPLQDEGAGVIVPLDSTDFECALCYRLFYKPVTTACGHTYCKECINTSLNYSPNCPICRRKIPTKHNGKEFDFSVNFTLATILEKHFAEEYKLRETEELRATVAAKHFSKDGSVDVPESESSQSCGNWYWSALLCDV